MELPPPPPPPPPSSPPERSKRLHNFTLPYRWGQQRYLRCVKLSHHRSPSSSSPSPDHTAPHRSPALNGLVISDSVAGDFGAKLRLDLVYDRKPKVSIIGNGGGEDARNGDVVAARPWNLRTRRAACNDPGEESTRIVESSLRRHEIGVKRGSENGDGDLQKNEKVKFSVSLLREEIEEDFSALIGKRPPRRPKKRPRIVQKQLNSLFPGMWLAEEVTADSYDVPEVLET